MTTQTHADPILFTTRHLSHGRGAAVWISSGLVGVMVLSFAVQLAICLVMLVGVIELDRGFFAETAFVALWLAFAAPFVYLAWSFGGEEEVVSVTRNHLRVSIERGGKELRYRWYPRRDVRNLRYDARARSLTFDWQQQKVVYLARTLRTFEAGLLRSKIKELWASEEEG